ncbi:hypothetical protein P1P75_11065 [Streptomyces sp. ID05-39B]|uniref:hypothetical protein n=1 Tax=Streptomyces sp. ID05-39B TaxID=3028664 RepID=UPI0029AE1EA3|nr:hypothetical protein [Streptomyces sp. ID05-39B]MDX3526962.1 hypothetical protein [Streptomyces sp. ID05-39B]
MKDAEGLSRNVAAFVVPQIGRLEETGEAVEPYQLLDPDRAACCTGGDVLR